MRKHVCFLLVLACTLSTLREGNHERTLPAQGPEVTVEQNKPGTR